MAHRTEGESLGGKKKISMHDTQVLGSESQFFSGWTGCGRRNGKNEVCEQRTACADNGQEQRN